MTTVLHVLHRKIDRRNGAVLLVVFHARIFCDACYVSGNGLLYLDITSPAKVTSRPPGDMKKIATKRLMGAEIFKDRRLTENFTRTNSQMIGSKN